MFVVFLLFSVVCKAPPEHNQTGDDGRVHIAVSLLFKWQCINIPGLKQARGGHWNPGILMEDSGGSSNRILGVKPPIFPSISRIPSQDSQVPVSSPGLFQAWNIDTLPYSPGLNKSF